MKKFVRVDFDDLRAAVSEVAEEARSGSKLEGALFERIARSFEVPPARLERAFSLQFPNGVGAKLSSAADHLKQKIADKIAKYLEECPDALVEEVNSGGLRTRIQRKSYGNIELDEWFCVEIIHRNGTEEIEYKAQRIWKELEIEKKFSDLIKSLKNT